MKFYKVALFLILLTSGKVFAQEMLSPEKKYEITNHKTAVEIAANIPDANVFLNDTYQGRTNLTVYDLTPGVYLLRLEKQGYEIQEFMVEVKNHYGQCYFVNMKR